ncbi:ABC transporter substrate-binding protein [Halobacterium litoreum]|uniref:ABC transporter substrate-binding protein n=1 Tax=Halobacterium litoreum TaxID=2039234 RepID=A0ABD5NHG8_9EURY|nr:ABC transporter substrate-binding protein [Halobacterium litoreum]UHH12455.1 ABC transporter substrate-binding protein [Halobacterium litoreum]
MSQRINRRDVIRGVGAASVVGLAGCTGGGGGDGDETTTTSGGGGGGGDDTTTTTSGGGGGSTARTLKQGILLPTTGGLADLGVPIKNGAELPRIVLEGETDFELDFNIQDTQTDANAAQSAAQSLRNGGYPAVTGAASSEVTMAVAENVFIPSGMVGCSPASTSPAITDLNDNGLIYRTPPTDALQGEVLAQVATERLGASTAATMYVNNSYGQLLSESFASAFQDLDGQVYQQVSFQKAQSSYTSRLSQAFNDNPDVIVVVGYPESGKQLFRNFYSDFDTDVPVLVTDGLRSASLPSDVGNPMENVTGTAPLAAGPGREFFDEQFQAEFGSEPGVFTAQAFDATAVCLLANAAAGENNGQAIAQQMQAVANPGGEEVLPDTLAEGLQMAAEGTEIQYKGASSAVDFDTNGDLKAATYEYFGFEAGGGIRTIDELAFSA